MASQIEAPVGDRAKDGKDAALGYVESNKLGDVTPHRGVEYHEADLRRKLASRHLMMLVIGGVIGPGYFVGMGNGLSQAGPAGLLLCFAIIGTVLWAVMQTLGELGAFIPVSGSFIHYSARFIDPAIGFSLGWNYWFLWMGIIMAEYNNLGLVLTYWDTPIPRWAWIIMFWSFFMAFQFFGIKSFGEAEFWLALAKVIAIAAFFLCAILISSGVIGGQKIGFKYYKDPGAFADGVKGVFKVFVFAALQYSGSEMVGLTAGESSNPAKDVPKAVRSVIWRILIIFIGGIFFLTITVPWNDDNLLSPKSKTAASPFVIAFTRVGSMAGAHAINAIIIVTILSAVNSAIYVGSRTLVGLASQGQAPKFFARTNSRGVPVIACVVVNLIGFLSLLNLSSGAGKLYTWIVSMTGVATFITCKFFTQLDLDICLTGIVAGACICCAQIRFRRALHQQDVSEDILPFKANQYVAWFGLIANMLFVVFQGWTSFAPWDLEAFFQNYIMLFIFLVLYGGWKFYHKTEWVNPKMADLISNRRDM
ncbi:amino-acid permease [Paramyrothecium foliicola]|nr:amino-acid permease [Paramyrothecium foliicola]